MNVETLRVSALSLALSCPSELIQILSAYLHCAVGESLSSTVRAGELKFAHLLDYSYLQCSTHFQRLLVTPSSSLRMAKVLARRPAASPCSKTSKRTLPAAYRNHVLILRNQHDGYIIRAHTSCTYSDPERWQHRTTTKHWYI